MTRDEQKAYAEEFWGITNYLPITAVSSSSIPHTTITGTAAR
jgi:hypothetical protein